MSLFNSLLNKKIKIQNKIKSQEMKTQSVNDEQDEVFGGKSSDILNQGDDKNIYKESVNTNTEQEEEYEVVEREIHPAKIICPDCGGITLEGLEFCDKCGGELQ